MVGRTGARLAIVAAVVFLWTAAAGAAAKGIFYTVSGKDTGACLLGSVHLGSEDFYPLASPVESCFKDSPVLALEIDPTSVAASGAQLQMLGMAVYPEGEGLKDHVSPATYRLAAAEWRRTGLPEETLDRFRPWMLALTLEMLSVERKGMSAEQGVEHYFLRKGEGKKRVEELESASLQMQLLNSFTDKEQEEFLLDTLRNGADDSLLEKMVQAWRSGDGAALERLVMQPLRDHPELTPVYEKLYFSRNRSMAARIEELMRGKSRPFVVIGAGHLLGDRGVVEILRKKGYRVEQR